MPSGRIASTQTVHLETTINRSPSPAGLPRPIVDKIATATQQALKDPAVEKRLLAVGTDPHFGGPDELSQFTRDEIARYRKFVALSGAKVE